MNDVPLTWSRREPPLAASGVVGEGAAALRLARALLLRDDAGLGRLEGVAGGDLLVVTGPRADLPWADGVIYVGRERADVSVWMPVHVAPSAPTDLLQRAASLRRLTLPVLLLPESGRAVSLADRRPIARGVLEAWVAARSAAAPERGDPA